MRHENHCFTTSLDSTGRGLVKLTNSYGSWTSIYILSLSNGMQFTNCTTRKPLFHDPYESWTCIYTPSPSNDMQFTNCTTRKPLFHDPHKSYQSYGSWTCIYTPTPSNDMQFTNCTTRKGRGLAYTPQFSLMICSSQTVRLVSHCFTTRTSCGLVYTPQVPLMICSSQTVRLVNHCLTTRTSRTNRTSSAKRNMPLYGSYQFVYIAQPSI